MRFLIETKVRKDLKDLTGQKFGDLTVLEYDKEKSRATGQTYWKCKCSCGKETSVARKHLLNGDIKSCGHTKRQNGLDHYEDNFKGMRDRQNKYHTNLEIIRNQKMQPNNTSGVKGVDYHKGRDMWRARVRVNGKELTKWSKDKDVAIKWRQDAIDKYYKPQIDRAIKAGDLKESLSDYGKVVSQCANDLTSFLDKYGFDIEIIGDYEFDDDSVGMFLNSMQDDASVFPIALNKDAILKYGDDLYLDVKSTLAHEVGHGLFEFLNSVYDLDNYDEEDLVEEFARDYCDNYLEDNELIGILNHYMNEED